MFECELVLCRPTHVRRRAARKQQIVVAVISSGAAPPPPYHHTAPVYHHMLANCNVTASAPAASLTALSASRRVLRDLVTRDVTVSFVCIRCHCGS